MRWRGEGFWRHRTDVIFSAHHLAGVMLAHRFRPGLAAAIFRLRRAAARPRGGDGLYEMKAVYASKAWRSWVDAFAVVRSRFGAILGLAVLGIFLLCSGTPGHLRMTLARAAATLGGFAERCSTAGWAMMLLGRVVRVRRVGAGDQPRLIPHADRRDVGLMTR